MASNGFIPALRFDSLTPFYDKVVRMTSREKAFKSALLAGARIERPHRLLDLGCGTGTLTILAKDLVPDAEVIGLDADPKVLEIARGKAADTRLDLQFDQGMSHLLPYPDASFDRVISSLFFHHLDRPAKIATLNEVKRVLKSEGELHIADWGRPSNSLMSIASYAVKLLDGFETTGDSFAGLLSTLLGEAGFERVEEDLRTFDTLFGTIRIHRSTKEL